MDGNKKNSVDGYQAAAIKIAPPGSYFDRTSKPVYALIYLLPFVIIYEILVLVINPQLLSEPINNVRGGVVAFVWIQNLMQYLGVGSRGAWLVAPFVVIIILLTLQIFSRQKWKILPLDFLPMLIESISLSIPLIVLAIVLNRPGPARQSSVFLENHPGIASCSSAHQQEGAGQNATTVSQPKNLNHPLTLDIVTGIGAGIYEELVFRLILICGLMLFFETILGMRKNKAVIISILISSLLFSLHHHIVFLDGQIIKRELFTITRFAFRSVAGVYFAVIFAVRGFGVTAGAHIFYDIIAVLLNALLFANN